MNEKKYYIAYGSNLSVEQMAQRCPDARIVGQAVLEDWELAFHGCATMTVTAMVYIMEDTYGERMPSRYYYRVLHDGYKAFHFPMHILEGALKKCTSNKKLAENMIKEVQG